MRNLIPRTGTLTSTARLPLILAMAGLVVTSAAPAQPADVGSNTPASAGQATNQFRGRGGRGGGDSTNIVRLRDLRAQDVCIRPDPATKLYYMVAAGVRA